MECPSSVEMANFKNNGFKTLHITTPWIDQVNPLYYIPSMYRWVMKENATLTIFNISLDEHTPYLGYKWHSPTNTLAIQKLPSLSGQVMLSLQTYGWLTVTRQCIINIEEKVKR